MTDHPPINGTIARRPRRTEARAPDPELIVRMQRDFQDVHTSAFAAGVEDMAAQVLDDAHRHDDDAKVHADRCQQAVDAGNPQQVITHAVRWAEALAAGRALRESGEAR